ncbi:MAG TPA: c-type cytochrome [Terriglobales bacterium]|nr:c-type cytochrome [Terriglobales bacterium]
MKTAFRTQRRVLMVWLAMVGSLVFNTANCSAQGFRWPEEPKNLKVLPKGTKGAQLGEVMRGFAFALDVRCQHCHVGEGSDLTKFDFPSDEKITKQKARLMIQMVQDINQTYLTQLTKLESAPQERVEVTCMTCHRTASKPEMLGDILARTIEKEGVDAAITQYRELRKSNYGGFAYDFSTGMLTALGERLASGGKVDAALRILDLEKEVNGESASIYFTRGRIEVHAGLRDQAIHSFERGLELAPEDWKPFFRQQLEKLRKE